MDPTPDEYAAAINAAIGAEIQRRRKALGMSVYGLAKAAGDFSDQTILNIERGHCPNGCLTGTLARICHGLGTTLTDLVAEAEWV